MQVLQQRRFIPIRVLMVLSMVLGVVQAQKFHPSDPMWFDNDQLVDVTAEPEEIELSDLYDRFGHMFVQIGDPNFSESQNVNTLDEVPDSSWFTNRHWKRRMTLDELCCAANFNGPPNPADEWTVFRGKSQGITPGFSIEDAQGVRYVIKFDPVDVPELATAAESIASKIFYALGFNVPENYIVYLRPENLRIKPGTMVSDQFGDKVPLTDFRLNRMMRKVPRLPDGTIRVIASRYIEGKPLGPFRYSGTRSDDPNDVIPHEHRRELRGLRLFAAWTNHDDTRAQNTQDSWVMQDNRHFIRHYLMDFGSTFGSGSVQMQLGYLGFDYSIPIRQMQRRAVRFGFEVPTYRKVDWPDFPDHKAVGRWETEYFEPETWKNDYPNPAFVRMTARDAFWAARLIMQFTQEELMAIVRTGAFSKSSDERYFHRVLVERQRRCGSFGINGLNPLDEFRVEGNVLLFTNLSEKYGFSGSEATRYQVTWSSFDNQAAATGERLRGPDVISASQIEVPSFLGANSVKPEFLEVEIASLHSHFPHWSKAIRLYLRRSGEGWEIVGMERDSPAEAIPMG